MDITPETPEVWTAKQIADWLKLSRRHVVDRLVHSPRFPKPLNGSKGRWLKLDVIEWAIRR